MAKRYKEPEIQNKQEKNISPEIYVNKKGKHEKEEPVKSEKNKEKEAKTRKTKEKKSTKNIKNLEQKNNKNMEKEKNKKQKSKEDLKVKKQAIKPDRSKIKKNAIKQQKNKKREKNKKRNFNNNEENIREIELELESIKPKKELTRKEKKKIKKEKQKEEKLKAKLREKRIQEKNKIKQLQKKRENSNEDIFDIDLAIKLAKKNNIMKSDLKKQEQLEKKNKRNKRILTIIIIIVLICGGIIFLFTSPIFNIKDIQVLNNSQVSSDTIISLSGLEKNENIFKFLKINIENNIKQNSFVDSVEIKRVLPDKVQLIIEERAKKFSVQFLNSYAIISSQGYILEISEENQGLIVLKGMTTSQENFSVGNRLENNDLEKLEDAIKIVNTCKDNNLDTQITYIDMSDKTNYTIYMEQEKKTIYIGDNSNLSNKIIYVQAIINETKGEQGEIFVNGDLNNKFKPYFREKIN